MLVLIMFSCVPVCVQETLEYWRMWAERWCYTNEPSCPTLPIPANARVPATRQRCSSTPDWSARTVLRGSCSTAPEHTQHHTTAPFFNTREYTPPSNVFLFMLLYLCVLSLSVKVLFVALVVSPCYTLPRLEQCSSHLPYIYIPTHHSVISSLHSFYFQLCSIHSRFSSCASFCLIWLHTGTRTLVCHFNNTFFFCFFCAPPHLLRV